MPEQNRGDAFARLLERWRAGGAAAPAILMGVVNVTPDSFSDGDLFASPEAAIAKARRLAADGAAIIDIGGESTRPGAEPVSAQEEAARILPVISALANSDLLISVDTVKASVAEKALAAGAHMVNDIQGLQGEAAMAGVVAGHGAGLVIMYNRGLTGSSKGTNGDPVAACLTFFEASLAIAEKAGIAADRVVLDPGIGFGKTAQQNIALIARLPELLTFGKPVLIGASRKSFIGTLLDRPVGKRLAGTLALHVAAALSGAAILRVHDVGEHHDAAAMAAAIIAAQMRENRP
ncbi:MAG: dihydropteroate synthase [Alphaproteobacteria bacterium]|nr:MAG: dihydropteroate synthase [Alphaproteobacteria bacterium]